MLVILALVVFGLGFIAGMRVNSFLGDMVLSDMVLGDRVMLVAAGVLLGDIVWMYFTITVGDCRKRCNGERLA
jgi:hypothetical protein